ncbi:collagen-like domain-containing protein [Vallitalea okinawensis]|uniref:collagen-like protein n=1 Tax=Vallitalea okinawensis TaxID=2078660 RepID=UPI000CFB6249|nr:collagen-like protein [Vallitalea okinawensis]
MKKIGHKDQVEHEDRLAINKLTKVNSNELAKVNNNMLHDQQNSNPLVKRGSKEETVSQGEKGPKGDTGPQGEKGPKGDMGPQGDRGPKGDVGLQGDRGPKGDMGSQGDRGPKGDVGLQGDRGPKGDLGPKGEKGDSGEFIGKGSLMAWEKFINHLLTLNIVTVDFCTTTQKPCYINNPLSPIENFMIEIGDFIIPIWQLIGIKLTVRADEITDDELLNGLIILPQYSFSECEYFFRQRLQQLQANEIIININTLGDQYYFNINKVMIVGIGIGIILVKPLDLTTDHDYFALSISKIASIEKYKEKRGLTSEM